MYETAVAVNSIYCNNSYLWVAAEPNAYHRHRHMHTKLNDFGFSNLGTHIHLLRQLHKNCLYNCWHELWTFCVQLVKFRLFLWLRMVVIWFFPCFIFLYVLEDYYGFDFQIKQKINANRLLLNSGKLTEFPGWHMFSKIYVILHKIREKRL